MRQVGELITGLALLLGFGFHAPAVLAQERGEDECARLHPGIASPVEMAACTFNIDGSNSSLHSAYGKLAAKVRPEYRRSLKQAHRAWIAYRDAQCAYEASGHQGTMGSSAVIACTAQMNRARAKYLKDDLDRWKP